jgi:predicted alpha/beta superfamily hydrolase
MIILKPTKLIITIILFLIFSTMAFGQKLAPKERITEPDHTISSKITGKDYQLYISFPKNYSTKDIISYPVLYVLDGEPTFPIIKGTRRFLDWGKEIEDLIIVGISSSNWFEDKYNDYTISVSTSYDQRSDKKYGAPKGTYKSGGTNKFLESIKTEINPVIDINYKTNSDRGITGSSYGGLFTAYCLVNPQE